ncbi:peptide deformylase [Candidatus Wolfebacteria bacterium]|nr:peptide deformylase [Candidatus Wolfebacteria bacterium]
MAEQKIKIFTINNKKEEKFLRQRVADFNFRKITKKQVSELVDAMKKIMEMADGVGLAANQIGLNLRVFTARVYDEPLKRDENGKLILPASSAMKFYAIFNPEIIKFSSKIILAEEGCLSVPGVYGDVPRYEAVTITGYDKAGKKIKIRARGLLARIFQHETDHLNGILFIDKAKNLRKAEKTK